MAHFSDAFIIKKFEVDDFVPVTRRRTANLKELCETTKFSRRELKLMYHGFKQECPNGCMDLKQFTKVFASLFPGDAGPYARLVFKTFEKEDEEFVTFKEYAALQSILSRGTEEEKLSWIFRLYDCEGKGELNKRQIFELIQAIFRLFQKNATSLDHSYISRRVQNFFAKMGAEDTGVVTREHFLEKCLRDNTLCQQLEIMNTFV
uniref:Uncharacterized protein n=1 Tax=Romanomermis culicivorax TaxID=13658 RepID=A0A915K152_ROMCU